MVYEPSLSVDPSPRLVAAGAVAVACEVLLAAAGADLCNPLVFANYAEQRDATWRHRMLANFGVREMAYRAVHLVRYPARTVVDATNDYMVFTGDGFVEEQIPPADQDLGAALISVTRGGRDAIAVRPECLLLARYGEAVWGHWVFELLAKAVLAENAYPGRFSFLIGPHPAAPAGERGYRDAVLESLAAYGIEAERTILLDRSERYRFDALFDVAGIRNKPQGSHPGVLDALRGLPARDVLRHAVPRLAACRSRNRYRSIHNHRALRSWFADHGFLEVDLTQTPFSVQVELFRQADFVIASLGSDCTSLLHCRPGTRVITLAPAGWADDYFVPLLQGRDFVVGDVRGAASASGIDEVALASHGIDPATLAQAFERVRGFSSQPSSCVVEVDGELFPRYRLRETASIHFGLNGNEAAWLGTGWSGAESKLRWSIGLESILRLPAGFLPAIDLLLEIDGINAVAPPQLVSKPLAVFLDGKPLASFTTLHHDRLYCRIPASWIGRETMKLTFRHPICPSPRSLGLGDDDRNLGFGFRRLRFLDPS